MPKEVLVYEDREYRYHEGQILDRRIERNRCKPEHDAWLVLDPGEIIPPVILQNFRGQPPLNRLRWD